MIKYKILLTKKTNKGNLSRDKCLISDGKMVTGHNNPADTFRIYKEKKDKGENVEFVKRGILLEHFDKKTSKEIKDHVVKELEIMREKFKSDMEISWVVEEC